MLRVFAAEAAPEEKEVGRFFLGQPSDGDVRELIAHSETLLNVIEKAKIVARGKLSVLVQGETGTGKELIARLIHEHSPRRNQRFVQVNCAAFSETLIESEMFGHEKGAFTGADQRHAGYFERAHQGSLLLDEIGEMPLKMQAKLLRVLEEEAFERVGGEQMLRVDVRVIATTNRDLEQEISRGTFRPDLYYRLNALPLHVPPLRLRTEEIPALVAHFLNRFGKEGAVEVTSIHPDALALLRAYSWPGNIRQLRNVIHYASVLARSSRIEARDLPLLPHPATESIETGPNRTLAQMERQMILETLREVGGNRTAAALRLGVTTRTLHNKLSRYRAEEAA
jgi:transcriptional regulator with PAS, ATPase and Fis domain